MTTEIKKVENKELAQSSDNGANVMRLLQSAMDQGHPVEVVERLLDMQERILATQAKQAYAAAMHSVQSKIGAVRKAGWNSHTKKHHGRLEDAWRELRPLIDENGLSVSCGEGERTESGITFVATVRHVLGHSEQYKISLPPDTSGSKNSIQAVGSTHQYARRYLVCCDIFGIVFADEDDDGIQGGAEKISEEQELELDALVQLLPKDRQEALKKWAEISKLSDLPVSKYKTVFDRVKAAVDAQHG